MANTRITGPIREIDTDTDTSTGGGSDGGGGGYPDNWDTLRRQVYARDGYECANCGARGGPHGDTELHAHHIVNVASGGTHRMSKLITLCKACHRATHNPGVMAPTAGAQRTPAAHRSTWSERNGRFWVHVVLLAFTFGIGNVVYWWLARRRWQRTRDREMITPE